MMYSDTAINYWRLMRFDKPIGIFLLLWPTAWALWIAAGGAPDLKIIFIFTLGVILMRAAGCVVNDIADRKIDQQVERTRLRPIAAGVVTVKQALILFSILVSGAFILVLFLNKVTILLSFGAVALAVSYPFMKRVTYLPQVVLGAAFGWSIPMAFSAVTGEVPAVAWLLFVATVLWTVAYDTMYAMVDRNDDLRIGVKSTAILFGDMDRLMIGLLQLLAIIFLWVAGEQLSLSYYYYLGLIVATILAVYQQYLLRNRDREACFQAFLNNNGFGGAIFFGIVLHFQFLVS